MFSPVPAVHMGFVEALKLLIVAVGGQLLMVIDVVEFVPNEGRVAVMFAVPGVLLAVNATLKFPDASVVVKG